MVLPIQPVDNEKQLGLSVMLSLLQPSLSFLLNVFRLDLGVDGRALDVIVDFCVADSWVLATSFVDLMAYVSP